MTPEFGFCKGLVGVLWRGVVLLEGVRFIFVSEKVYCDGICKGVGLGRLFKKWKKKSKS